MNKIILLGNLGRDPLVKRTLKADGSTMVFARFDLFVRRRTKTRDGKDSDIFHCNAFGKTAELIEKYLSKGSRIVVVGRVENNNYVDKNGNQVYGFSVIVDEIEFAGSKPHNNNNSYNNSYSANSNNNYPANDYQTSYNQF